MRYPVITVKFPGGPARLSVARSTNLYAALSSLLPGYAAPCEGRGLCGRCAVRISPPPPPSAGDLARLSTEEIAQGWRLACGHQVDASLTVALAETGPRPPRI